MASSSLLLAKRLSLLLPSIKPLPSFRTHSTRLPHQLQLFSKPVQTQTRFFTQSYKSSANMSQPFLDSLKDRRSHYPLKKESPIDDKKIQDIVTQALLHTPSSFNSQSTRVVVLLKAEHEKLWEITKTTLKAIVPADTYGATEQKLDMFKGAYGTVSVILSPFDFTQIWCCPASGQSSQTREELVTQHNVTLSEITLTIQNRFSSSMTAQSLTSSKKATPPTPTSSQVGPPNLTA